MNTIQHVAQFSIERCLRYNGTLPISCRHWLFALPVEMIFAMLSSPMLIVNTSSKRAKKTTMATNSIAIKYSESSQSMQFFDAVEEKNGNKMFKCKLCSCSRNGNKTSNLVAHIKTNHNEVYVSQIKRSHDSADLSLKLERLQLLQICVELTTINKQPFAHILHSAFQKLISSQLVKFEMAGDPLDLKSKNLTPVKEHLRCTAAKVRNKITAELEKKLLSVSVDIVTKNHRCILGIYVQFTANGKLVVRCICMEEMHERHTGKYIAEMLKSCLNRYCVDSKNIVSITTDNASNMRSFITNINDELQHQNEEEIADDLDNLGNLSINDHDQGRSQEQ